MWFRTIEINGLEFSMCGSHDCDLMLSKEQIEAAGDRIGEILDWFLENGEEFALVETWEECHYDRQFFSPEQLRIIANSSFASEQARDAVFERPERYQNPPHPRKPKQKGYIYVIQGQDNTYKIGRSKDAQARITTLGITLPFPITPICIIESPDMIRTEKELHARFQHRRVNGEWFALSSEDLEHIKGL